MKLKRWTAAVMAAVMTFASIPMSSSAVTPAPRPRNTPGAMVSTVQTSSDATSSIKINNMKATMKVGDEVDINTTVVLATNSNASDVKDLTYEWKVTGNNDIIDFQVDVASSSNATIKAKKPGKATVKVNFKAENYPNASWGTGSSSVYNIEVTDDKIVTISVAPEALELTVGKSSKSVVATVGGNATGKDVVWKITSGSEFITIATSTDASKVKEATAKVSPVKEGIATLSATAGGKPAICTVTVKPKDVPEPIKSIKLNMNELTLMKGKSGETLTATVDAKELADNVEWSFSKDGIVERSEATSNINEGTSNIQVKPVAVGQTTVTAKDKNGTQKAVCVINVVAVPKVKLDSASLSMKTGDSKYVKFISDSNIKFDKISWSVSDKEALALDVAAGQKSAKVTALKAGKTTVMVDAFFHNEVVASAKCEVTAENPASPILKLEKTEIELAKEVVSNNTTYPGKAEIRVINTTGKEADVSVNNGNVKAEKITKDGILLITAVEAGTSIVTVKAGSLSATCTVTVTDTAGLDVKPSESEVEVDLETVKTPDVPSGSKDKPEDIKRKTDEAVTKITNEILANMAALEPAKGLMKAINFALLKAELGLSEGETVSVKIAPKLHTLKMEAVVDPKTGETKVVPVSMTFDVKPMAVMANGNAVIKNEWLKNARITFRLPMPSDAPTSSVLVNHEGTNLGYFAIKNKDTDEAYVEVDGISEFSNFTVTFKDKPSSSSGSGSGSAKGTSSTAKSNGEWMANGANWQYRYSDGTYARNEWTVIVWNGQPNWYHFNAEAMLDTGWIQDGGRWYYLHPQADGNRGYMYTGWRMIDGKWYYFYEVTGGPLGAMAANTTTPDGYVVGADGAWIQ